MMCFESRIAVCVTCAQRGILQVRFSAGFNRVRRSDRSQVMERFVNAPERKGLGVEAEGKALVEREGFLEARRGFGLSSLA
jgi:hypothetical protein